MSIGKDVYLDTRLIISKLEGMYPSLPKLSATATPEQAAIQSLLESFIVDGGVFASSARLLPPTLPLLKDPKFQKDRQDFQGVKMSGKEAMALRPEASNEIARCMELLERTLLGDGREWLLNTPKPTLADIEAVWPLHWLVSMPGALPPTVSAKEFPKVFAWIARFDQTTRAVSKQVGKPKTVKGEEAKKIILGAQWNEKEGEVDGRQHLVEYHKLKKGSKVALWPTDTGASYKDVGELVSLDDKEVVIVPEGAEIRLHAPRHGFRIRPAEESAKL